MYHRNYLSLATLGFGEIVRAVNMTLGGTGKISGAVIGAIAIWLSSQKYFILRKQWAGKIIQIPFYKKELKF